MYDPWTQDIEWIAKLFNKTFMEDLSDLETKIALHLVECGYLMIMKGSGGKDTLIYTYYPSK